MTGQRPPLKDAKAAPSGAQLMVTALAAGTCAVVLIFLVFAFYNDLSQREIRRSEVEKYLNTVSSSTAWGIDKWLDVRVRLAEEMVQHLYKDDTGGDLTGYLKSPVYEKTFLWTTYGKVDGSFYSWPLDETFPAGYDPRTRPWYIAAVTAGGTTLTEPYIDYAEDIELMTVSVPIYRDGALVGAIGADFSTDALQKVLNNTRHSGLGDTFVATSDGKIIVHPNRDLVSKSLAEAYPGASLELHDSVQYLDDMDNPQILRFEQIPSLAGVNWYLGFSIDRNKAFAAITEFRSSAIVATIAAALLMILVLGVVIHRLLVQPLMRERIAADAANAAKSEFLASMSHEIRTPMNGVLGMAEVLLHADLNDRQRELAAIIVSSGHALMTIINDILDFSKLEAGKFRLIPHEFNLRQTMHEVATLMQARANEKDLELIVRYSPNLTEGVVADETRLRQVLSNLLGNAVKFTERGHVLIEVAGERTSDDLKLVISVEDTGVGIAPEQLPRMFERFEQEDKSNTRRHGGTGLGLAICRDLVTLMGGEIGAESEPGKGSRFWFSITVPACDKIAPIAVIDDVAFEGVRILAVDDNAINRRVIKEMMDAWGLRASITSNSAETLAALELSIASNDPYHVILMDYQMPEEDGAELTRRIQTLERFRSIPVIMFSSIDPAQTREALNIADFAAQIHKPLRPSELMDVLVRSLSEKNPVLLARAAQELREPSKGESLVEAPHSASTPRGVNRLTLLVAEDNAVNRLVLKNMIGEDAYNIIFAENGQEAIDLFVEHAPDIIVMDITMPIVDGFEATRRIRAIETERGLQRTPIIAATAHVFEQDQERCRQSGMDDYVSKPVRKQMLEEVIGRWAGKCEAALEDDASKKRAGSSL